MSESPLSTISEGIIRVACGAYFYIIDGTERIAIDTGVRSQRQLLHQLVKPAIPFESVKKVILTHAHARHSGNFDLFPQATIYMHEEELWQLRRDARGAVLDPDTAEKLLAATIEPLPAAINDLQVIHTPGHTSGSVCLWWEEKKALFTGDTLLQDKTGRVDLPTSSPEQMGRSLSKLVPFNHQILCPGH